MMTEFAEFVTRQQEIGATVDDIVHLQVPEDPAVVADVRLKGAMVLGCTLANERGDHEAVLSTASSVRDYTAPKLGATHPMAPVGPYDGPGGQHGPLRWLPYITAYQQASDESKVTLMPTGPRGPFDIVRTVWLARTSIGVATSLENRTGDSAKTSIGEHAYFAMPVTPSSPDTLLINGVPLDDPLIGGKNAFTSLMGGQAIYWRNFGGQAKVQFPDGKRVDIEATLVRDGSGPRDLIPDMLIWHRPGTDTVCFEPIGGCVPGETREQPIEDNRALSLRPGQAVELATTVTLR